MIAIQRLVLLLTLGLALALAGCGGDDDDNGNGGNGGCEGSNASLVGSCVEVDGSCAEARGNYGGNDPSTDCADGGGTWSTSGCPASTKTSGACVIGVYGAYAVGYDPSVTPEEWESYCLGTGFGCFIAP